MPEKTLKKTHGGNVWEAAKAMGLQPEKVLDFSASLNPLGMPQGAVDAIKDALRKGLAQPYPDPGAAELRHGLASYYGVSAQEVVPGNGSTEFIYLIPRLLRPATALIVEPAFSEYRTALKLTGCRVDSFNLKESDGFSLDPARLKKALDKKRYDLLYVSNPANPTGVLTSTDVIAGIARYCKRSGTTVVADEAFLDFCQAQSVKAEATRLGNLIVLRSMTKYFAMAGLRLGALVGHRDTVKKLAIHVPPWSVNTLAALAAIAALQDMDFRRRTRLLITREMPFLADGINAITGLRAYPGAANYLMVKITGGRAKAAALRDRLFEKGVLIRDLGNFSGLENGYFRVCVKKRRDNGILLRALRQAMARLSQGVF